MDPKTHPNVVYYRGNFALLNPEGSLAKVNKYTVMYIVEFKYGMEDRPVLLLYHKNRKKVCMSSLDEPQYFDSNDFIDYTHVITVALERMH